MWLSFGRADRRGCEMARLTAMALVWQGRPLWHGFGGFAVQNRLEAIENPRRRTSDLQKDSLRRAITVILATRKEAAAGLAAPGETHLQPCHPERRSGILAAGKTQPPGKPTASHARTRLQGRAASGSTKRPGHSFSSRRQTSPNGSSPSWKRDIQVNPFTNTSSSVAYTAEMSA